MILSIRAATNETDISRVPSTTIPLVEARPKIIMARVYNMQNKLLEVQCDIIIYNEEVELMN